MAGWKAKSAHAKEFRWIKKSYLFLNVYPHAIVKCTRFNVVLDGKMTRRVREVRYALRSNRGTASRASSWPQGSTGSEGC